MNKNLMKLMVVKMKLAKIRKEEKDLESQIEKIREGCEHEIIIKTCKHDSKVIKGLVAYPSTTCLFCEEHLAPRKYLPDKDIKKMLKSVEINFNEYPKLFEKWSGKWAIQLRELYIEIKKENPNMSDYDIGKKMIKKMQILENNV